MRRIVQEARLFASIKDVHIVRYHDSWIEVEESVMEVDFGEEVERIIETSVELESPFIEFDGLSEELDEVIDEKVSRKSSDKVIKISLYIQMELCKGTLEDYLNKRSFELTEEEYNRSFDIARQLIEAIQIVHSDYKIIHRDISLRNLFIGKDNKIKIGDFGLATKRHNIIPLLSSPLLSKSIIDFKESDYFSLEDNIESEEELTHGLGTKTFAAPEQMSNLPYNQKADIYSLGLVLLILFYPTKTLSERCEVLKNCREQILPQEFVENYPELSELIKQMTTNDPELRPTAEDLLKSRFFSVKKSSNNWSKLNVTDKTFKVKLETADQFKERFLKIIGDTLLIYKDKNRKAKLAYPLDESFIIIQHSKRIRKSICTASDLKENLESIKGPCKVIIEHHQLETMEILI